MRTGKAAAAVGLCMGVLLLGGCEMLNQDKRWEPREADAISISEEGSITEYVRDTLDEAYYSAAELEQMIQSEVSDYNAKNGADSVQVKEFTAEGSDVRLTMEYAKAEDYAAFNNVEFYYGSMINAQLNGYLFDGSYKRVRDGVVQGAAVSGSEVLKKMAAEVLIVTAPLEVHLPGSVIFTGTNAEVLSASDVNATGKTDAEAENTGLVLPSSAVYTGEEKSFEERAAANRVYIIFEMQ